MSRLDVRRLRAKVAALRAEKLAAAAAPIAAEALRAARFRVHGHWDGGLSVDEAPGLSEKLEELRAAGIDPGLVVILRNIADEDSTGGRAPSERVGTGPGEGTGASLSPGPATLSPSPKRPIRERDPGSLTGEKPE